jgi:hypothetical protein
MGVLRDRQDGAITLFGSGLLVVAMARIRSTGRIVSFGVCDPLGGGKGWLLKKMMDAMRRGTDQENQK